LVTDRTVINLGQVRLLKTQALSADCSTAPTAYVTTDLKAKPGECVYYRIVATNEGNADAKSVTITDMVPSYTVLQAGSIKPAEATASNGQISYAVGTLTPASSATLDFAVKVETK
jgi:trimeric autotransporter adhesin